jgi:hypothetical protein
VQENVATSAGNVEFVRIGAPDTMPNHWQIKLKGKVLYENVESYGGFFLEKTFKNFAGKEDVIVFMESEGGNACPGGVFKVLVVRSNGTYYISPDSIGNCNSPKFLQSGDKLTISFPRSRVLRGTGFVPAETWVYQNGKLTQQKTVKSGR